MSDVNPWYIPGWTVQNQIDGPEDSPTPPPTLPEGIVQVTVEDTYMQGDEVPVSGTVSFIPRPNRIVDAATGISVYLAEVIGEVKGGRLSEELIAHEGLTYRVVEHFPRGRKFTISIPVDATSPQKVHDLEVTT